MAYRREQSAGYLTNWTARLFARALERRLVDGGGSGSMPVFFALTSEGEMNQSALARWAGVEQPTMANTLNRMERDGLIVRAPDPADGRSARVSLTRLGRQRASEALTVAQEVNALGLSALKPAEREHYLDMVKRIAATLEADGQ
ncbi:MAG: MarR family transcriptional regulator [Devosia sp.]